MVGDRADHLRVSVGVLQQHGRGLLEHHGRDERELHAWCPANLGATIRVVVTATNAAGSASASSAATALVAAAGPVNIVLPVISGTTTDGQTLGASSGTWTGTPTITYAYQWQSCNSSGGGCANVSGATSTSYALHPSDVGSTLRVIVTATNAAGAASATSAASAVIAPAAPSNTVAAGDRGHAD